MCILWLFAKKVITIILRGDRMYKESEFNNIITINGKKHIYNSMTKAYIKIHDDLSIREIVNKINNKEKNHLFFELIKYGFIIEKDFDEISLLEYGYNKTYFNTSNLNVVLVPTLKCNFSCPYCFEKGYNIEENKKYFEILKKFSIINFKSCSNIQISLFGGEPLLKEKDLFDYLEFLSKLKEKYIFSLSSSIVTNGSLITEDTVKTLIKYSCRSIQITIDGDQKRHDELRKFVNDKPSYYLLLSKIEMILNLTKNTQNFTFILRINLKDIEEDEIMESLSNIDKKYRSRISILFRPIYNTKKYIFENKNSFEELKKFLDLGVELGYNVVKNRSFYKSCESCGDDNFYYIMPDLKLWKCIGDLSYEKACIGKIDDEGELNINSQNMIDWFNASNCFKERECRECKLLPDCYGGCILYKIKSNERSCKTFDMAALPYLY